jgi:DNA-binding transcriptional LysR family regulator
MAACSISAEVTTAASGRPAPGVFERAGRRLRLTSAGRMLVDRARDLRGHLDSIEAELTDVTRGAAGHLRKGGFASSVEPILIEAIRTLQRTHPSLEIETREIEPHEGTTALDQGLCDIVITVDEHDGSLLVPAVTTVSLRTDPLLVVVPDGHRVAGLDVVPLHLTRVDRARVATAAADRWVESAVFTRAVPRRGARPSSR